MFKIQNIFIFILSPHTFDFLVDFLVPVVATAYLIKICNCFLSKLFLSTSLSLSTEILGEPLTANSSFPSFGLPDLFESLSAVTSAEKSVVVTSSCFEGYTAAAALSLLSFCI